MIKHYAKGVSAYTKCGLETFMIRSEKMTADKNNVTCKNCKRTLKQ